MFYYAIFISVYVQIYELEIYLPRERPGKYSLYTSLFQLKSKVICLGKKKVEDTKGVIGSRILKKDRQYNNQNKEDKRENHIIHGSHSLYVDLTC
jgi:hypothetical protein